MNSPLTVSAFLEFAESKPEREKYDYVDGNFCPIAQFLKSLGYTGVFVTPSQIGFREDNAEDFALFPIPDELNEAAGGMEMSVIEARPLWTFGQLAERLRELA